MSNSNITQDDIIKALHAELEFTSLAQAGVALKGFINVISDLLAKHGEVRLSGLGIFRVKKVEARTGPNPQKKGETIEIPAGKRVTFTASSTIKERLNGAKKKAAPAKGAKAAPPAKKKAKK